MVHYFRFHSTTEKKSLRMNEDNSDHEKVAFDPLLGEEPKNMAKVHEEYSRLESVISDIGFKVSDALNGQETEFLSVYKSIMDSAQIKVRDIKQDIEQKEKAIYDHVKVKELEKERDWYRQEALNLDKLLTESKKRETDLKERLDEVSSDRRWLSDQVKALMKRKAVLEEQVSQSKE